MNKEDLKVFLKIVGVVLLLLIVFVAFIYLVYLYDCNKLEINIEKETKYRFFGGSCLIKTEQGWIPRVNWLNNTGN